MEPRESAGLSSTVYETVVLAGELPRHAGASPPGVTPFSLYRHAAVRGAFRTTLHNYEAGVANLVVLLSATLSHGSNLEH
jgi:hypothetical protein